MLRSAAFIPSLDQPTRKLREIADHPVERYRQKEAVVARLWDSDLHTADLMWRHGCGKCGRLSAGPLPQGRLQSAFGPDPALARASCGGLGAKSPGERPRSPSPGPGGLAGGPGSTRAGDAYGAYLRPSRPMGAGGSPGETFPFGPRGGPWRASPRAPRLAPRFSRGPEHPAAAGPASAARALRSGGVTLLEAGPGTGKTFGYRAS